jgi:threonine/homoserine/homoserine lactone efflux protein
MTAGRSQRARRVVVSIEFLVTSLIVVASPGTGVLYTLAAGYGLFAAAIRNHVVSRPRVLTWMRRTFAAAFVALGAKLALAER